MGAVGNNSVVRKGESAIFVANYGPCGRSGWDKGE